MPTLFRYGNQSTVLLDLPPELVLADHSAPPGDPIDDPAAAVATALDNPLELPPLGRVTVPGDVVALALDARLPQTPAVVAGVVHALMQAEVEPENIVVLATRDAAGRTALDPRSQLLADLASVVRLEVHDPSDKRTLGYLAASSAGRAIYLNRILCEADVVIPLGCLRLPEVIDYGGIYAGLFPAFCDEGTIKRFGGATQFIGQSLESGDSDRRQEADEAGWLLGVQMTVQVVPGAGGQILHGLAGSVDAVRAEGERLCRSAWSVSVPRRAPLVITSIEGDAGDQTWENVAQALAAAARVVTDDGAVAICTDLDTAPGPALVRLAQTEGVDALLAQLVDETWFDATAAVQLAYALERGAVYLLSRLSEETVEDLGMAPLTDPRQVARLARRFDACILLGNAQHAVPEVAGEDT